MNAPESAREAHTGRIFQGLVKEAQEDPIATTAACDYLLEGIQSHLPAPEFGAASPFWNTSRQACATWAEVASDGQIAAMLLACLERIGDRRILARDREKLIVALWQGLPPERRTAFMAATGAQKKA